MYKAGVTKCRIWLCVYMFIYFHLKWVNLLRLFIMTPRYWYRHASQFPESVKYKFSSKISLTNRERRGGNNKLCRRSSRRSSSPRTSNVYNIGNSSSTHNNISDRIGSSIISMGCSSIGLACRLIFSLCLLPHHFVYFSSSRWLLSFFPYWQAKLLLHGCCQL